MSSLSSLQQLLDLYTQCPCGTAVRISVCDEGQNHLSFSGTTRWHSGTLAFLEVEPPVRNETTPRFVLNPALHSVLAVEQLHPSPRQPTRLLGSEIFPRPSPLPHRLQIIFPTPNQRPLIFKLQTTTTSVTVACQTDRSELHEPSLLLRRSAQHLSLVAKRPDATEGTSENEASLLFSPREGQEPCTTRDLSRRDIALGMNIHEHVRRACATSNQRPRRRRLAVVQTIWTKRPKRKVKTAARPLPLEPTRVSHRSTQTTSGKIRTDRLALPFCPDCVSLDTQGVLHPRCRLGAQGPNWTCGRCHLTIERLHPVPHTGALRTSTVVATSPRPCPDDPSSPSRNSRSADRDSTPLPPLDSLLLRKGRFAGRQETTFGMALYCASRAGGRIARPPKTMWQPVTRSWNRTASGIDWFDATSGQLIGATAQQTAPHTELDLSSLLETRSQWTIDLMSALPSTWFTPKFIDVTKTFVESMLPKHSTAVPSCDITTAPSDGGTIVSLTISTRPPLSAELENEQRVCLLDSEASPSPISQIAQATHSVTMPSLCTTIEDPHPQREEARSATPTCESTTVSAASDPDFNAPPAEVHSRLTGKRSERMLAAALRPYEFQVLPSMYSSGARVTHRATRVHPHARQPVLHSSRLAPIVSTTLDYARLFQMYPHLEDSLSMLIDETAFRERLTDEGRLRLPESGGTQDPHLLHGISRRMLHHSEDLLWWNVLRRPLQGETPEVCLPLFTVPKKDPNLLRLVVDARKLNRLLVTPPRMNIASIHDITDYLLDHNYAFTCDAKSYFYNFYVSPAVQRYFGCKMAGGRGHFKTFFLQRMAMGLSWAPFLAQEVSNALLCSDSESLSSPDGRAWLDNFLIAGETEAIAKTKGEAFLRRAKHINVPMDRESVEAQRHFSALGLEFDLEEHRFRLDESFIQQMPTVDAVRSKRTLFELIGSLVWSSYARRQPLCRHASSIEILRRACSGGDIDWDAPFALPQNDRETLEQWRIAAQKNHWISRQDLQVSRAAEVVWTDASDTHCAFVTKINDDLVSASVGRPPSFCNNIFLKEAYAIHMAVSHIAAERQKKREGDKLQPQPTRLTVKCDNKGLVYAIDRQLSSSPIVNRWITSWLDSGVVVHPEWVSTAIQLADPLTRGVTLEEFVTHELHKQENLARWRGTGKPSSAKTSSEQQQQQEPSCLF